MLKPSAVKYWPVTRLFTQGHPQLKILCCQILTEAEQFRGMCGSLGWICLLKRAFNASAITRSRLLCLRESHNTALRDKQPPNQHGSLALHCRILPIPKASPLLLLQDPDLQRNRGLEQPQSHMNTKPEKLFSYPSLNSQQVRVISHHFLASV